MHLRYHELLHIEYLEAVRVRAASTVSGLLPPHQPFGKWNNMNGYAGYIPTHKYFRNFYDALIETYAAETDQHMFMQSAEKLSADHSFKVGKHLGKISGVPVFGALHTAVNEYGEIRAMTLTPTKAHDDCMPALVKIPDSLAKYGHNELEVVFTDSMRGDKEALHRVFPSLLKNVTPVPSSSLEPLSLPANWEIYSLSSTYQVNTRVNTIMADLQDIGPDEELHLPMDMEWPVDRAMGIYGGVALVSIAYKKSVYLIPLVKYAQDNGSLKLPSPLLACLRLPRIRKVGVHVKADLTRLYHDCGYSSPSDEPFIGGLELGAMANDCNVVEHSNDSSIRISSEWDNPTLTGEQQTYAALDVYAGWAILNAFLVIPVGAPVTESTPGGTAVRLLSCNGKSTVAYGFVSHNRPKQYNGVNLTKTRILVNITSVVVPAYLIRGELVKSRKDTSLSELASSLPVSILCHLKDLQTCVGQDVTPSHPHHPVAQPPPPFESTYDPYSTEPHEENEDGAPLLDEAIGDNCLSWHNTLNYDPDIEQSLCNAVQDPDASQKADLLATAALQVPQQLACVPAADQSEVHSRVLGNIWHLMDQFKISLHHGLRRPFACALRDAIFIPDSEDKAAVLRVLEARCTTFQQMVLHDLGWVWQRVKRLVPPPEILTPQVLQVLHEFGPLKDAVTGQPLFSDASWNKAKNIIENIRLGYYSDPPGVKLYTVQQKDADKLTIYRCLRGTNNVEGGVHQNIIRRFGPFNASPRLAVNLLRDYSLSHNLKLPKHLKSYYKVWNENRNEHNSIEQNKAAYDVIRKLVTAPITIPPIPAGQRETVKDQIGGACHLPLSSEPPSVSITHLTTVEQQHT
ncbi:hypothetical protein BV22DRAFT_1133160 [Leucogyrophana mollusca]|uniref:Uncharacterized protein n=1 Tax=Leucogyrophana mollusca TaxID=85980 RepID=A0ACB8B6G9_9AGAM|nr:hypothetical protein BV22DRAFT_1133160 [Leucogyrophana mollusca]